MRRLTRGSRIGPSPRPVAFYVGAATGVACCPVVAAPLRPLPTQAICGALAGVSLMMAHDAARGARVVGDVRGEVPPPGACRPGSLRGGCSV